MQGKSLPGRYPATKDKNSMMGLPIPLDKWRTLPNKRMALDFAAMEERNARLAPLNPAMFAGAEWVIQYESSRLSQYKQDLIISIAMASGSSIKTTIDNLETIDLPLTAGVIIILDQLHTIDTDWYVVLLKALVKLEKSGKFVFVEAVHTTNRPLKDILPKALMSEVDKINAEEKAKFASAGYRIGGSSTLVNYQAVREQARLIIKYLQCKYVFWIDADVRLPHDTIGRLSKLIESGPNVGMAAGWYLNRHVSFEYPSFDSAVQCEPENEEERRYYERVFVFF